MSTTELKKRVIEKIETIQEDALLIEVLALLDLETTSDTYVLSSEQKSAIEISREQFKNGEYSTHEEVMEEMDQWLKQDKEPKGKDKI